MKTAVREYVVKELLSGEAIGDGDDLLLSGLVDSIGVMRLVAFVEERFGIGVPPEDVTVSNFATIEAVARYLDGRRAP